MNTRMLAYRPPRIAMGLLILALALDMLSPSREIQIVQSNLLGAIIGGTGFVLMIQAWWQFRKEKLAICPTSATHHLLTIGIFRVTRNPMYLGMTMMLLAVALSFGTLPFYVAVAAYFAIMNQAFCPYEEAKLTAAFGEEYLQYSASVRRWL